MAVSEKPPNPAAELKARRVAAGDTQEGLAKDLEVTQATVSRWESGSERPYALQRDALFARYGLKQAWWLTPPERELVAKQKKRRPRSGAAAC